VRHAISKNLREFLAVILMVFIALGVGGYILSNQRFYLPAWVPVLGTDFFELKAQFSTAQSVTPGQGQTAEIAGVPVGEIKRVELVDGRAVVTMAIRAKYRDMIKRDATMLLRPKTGLKDMVIEVDPGTRGAPEVPEGYTIPVSQTRPDVNLDEILANLDRDTRDYLRLLVAGGGEALKDNGPAFRNAFRRFEPLGKTTAKLTKLLAQRRRHLARLVHNLQLLVTEVGTKDKELAELVVSQNAVFEAFANQDANLRETFQLLPDTLKTTNSALASSAELTELLGPTLAKLRPGVRALDNAQRATQDFARETIPPIRDQVRPFTREAEPAARALRPAARDLAKITPQLEKSFDVINTLLNALGYNPPGTEEGYLFWALWLNHIGASVYSTQDAHGLVRRGIIFTDCIALGALEATRKIDNQLGTLIDLSNFATKQEACG
jgi:phospholipid/cholesterol/gamma-HCH transport system substrate-binding protein